MEYQNKLTVLKLFFGLFVVVCVLFIIVSLIKKKPPILSKTEQNWGSIIAVVEDVNYKQIANKEGLKYILQAREMKIYKGDIYFLYDVRLGCPTKRYGDVLITAREAKVNKEKDVQLKGNVMARSKDFTIKTEKANWDNKKNELFGWGKVTFKGEIDLTGRGFKYSRKKDILYVYHDVDVWIR